MPWGSTKLVFGFCVFAEDERTIPESTHDGALEEDAEQLQFLLRNQHTASAANEDVDPCAYQRLLFALFLRCSL